MHAPMALTQSVFLLGCYYCMQQPWLHYALSDVLFKAQTIGLGIVYIYDRMRFVIAVKDEYVFIYQFPFCTIVRLDEVQRIYVSDAQVCVQMCTGTELFRHYLFAVYPRTHSALELQRLIVLR